MFKLLLLLLGVWLAIKIIKLRRAHPPSNETGIKSMVRCSVCGIYLPDSEAIYKDGQHYCCEAHFSLREES